MLVCIVAVYWPVPSQPGPNVLVGSDHFVLHSRRIGYARDALFGPHPHLPGWYPRELLGTPFWANVQNFPFIPTRLVLLQLGPYTGYAPAVMLAAGLAGIFTFLYARRIGLGATAAAAAGWTFACAGFFASRVLAGHLPLLEAYPALPLLLWLAEVCLRPSGRPPRGWADFKLPGLGAAACCVTLAGHPQVPAYALGVTVLYVLWNGRGTGRRRPVLAALVLGAGAAAFAWWPMLRLIGRSTRVLALDPPDNDIPLPVGRLPAFLFPWRDGWSGPFASPPSRPFAGYPNANYFWDTVCYVGWLPLLAAVGLAAAAVWRRRIPPRPWVFLAVVGATALLLALSPVHALTAGLPGTFLRSPARQLYVTTFTLALAVGAATDAVWRWQLNRNKEDTLPHRPGRRARWSYAVVAVMLAAHALDLGAHDRAFVVTMGLPADFPEAPAGAADAEAETEGGRVAIDYLLWFPLNRQIDDVGFFDSIMLARPYRLLLDLAGAPPTRNVQAFGGSQIPARALASLGVKLVVTPSPRGDLSRMGEALPGVPAYRVPDPSPRAAFFPATSVRYGDPAAARAAVREAGAIPTTPTLPTAARPPNAAVPAVPDGRPAPPVTYRRPDGDEIVIGVGAAEPGFVRVLESWDPGWSATVDGAAAAVLTADDVFLCVPVPAGGREVRLTYRTPGAWAGLAVSACCIGGLIFMAVWSARRSRGRMGASTPLPATPAGVASRKN